MNGKKAKKCRAIARKVNVPGKTTYKGENVHFFNETDENGVVHLMKTKGVPFRMELCTRSVYKEIKRESKK